MGRIVGVPKVNVRDHLLHDLQEILLSSLPDLPGRQRCRRMGDEEGTEALLHFRLPDHCLNPIGHIHNLFPIRGPDMQELTHVRDRFGN